MFVHVHSIENMRNYIKGIILRDLAMSARGQPLSLLIMFISTPLLVSFFFVCLFVLLNYCSIQLTFYVNVMCPTSLDHHFVDKILTEKLMGK